MSAHTPGPWRVEEYRAEKGSRALISGPGTPDQGECEWQEFASVVVRMEGDDEDDRHGLANARLIAAAPLLADALEAYVADAEESSESYDRAAEEFRRDTGFLAPGKDEAAAVNGGVTHEERSHAWNIWVGKRRRTQRENALTALRAAGRLP